MDWGRILGSSGSGAATGASIGSIIPGIGTGIGAGIGGGLGFLNSLFGKDPYEEAQKQAQEGWQQAQQYEQPYHQQGLDQYGRLNQATGELLNPAELQNQWASGYESSPYAKQLLAMNQSQGLDAASQMGLLGSSAALGNIQQGAGNIVAQDRQKYLDDLMQKYMQGIGLGKDIYGVGAQAGTNLGAQAMTQGENMAQLRAGHSIYPQQQLENAAGIALKLNQLTNPNQFNQNMPAYARNAIRRGW
jgi:hypothetical protein